MDSRAVTVTQEKIFDRHLKCKQRDGAAWLMRPNDSFVDAVADNLLDRLEVVYPTRLFHRGFLYKVFSSHPLIIKSNWDAFGLLGAEIIEAINAIACFDRTLKGNLFFGLSVLLICGIEKLIMVDTLYNMLKVCKDAQQDAYNENVETSYVVGDEEFVPLKERFGDQLLGAP